MDEQIVFGDRMIPVKKNTMRLAGKSRSPAKTSFFPVFSASFFNFIRKKQIVISREAIRGPNFFTYHGTSGNSVFLRFYKG